MENMKMTRNGAELKVTPGLKLTSAEAPELQAAL